MGMDSRTGDIYEGNDMKDLMNNFKKEIAPTMGMLSAAEQEAELKKRLLVFPFQVGDAVELCGMLFKVEKIRKNPVNRVMLQGIPQEPTSRPLNAKDVDMTPDEEANMI